MTGNFCSRTVPSSDFYPKLDLMIFPQAGAGDSLGRCNTSGAENSFGAHFTCACRTEGV
jgi:hypothetical protein